ncbi:MAG: hypothetical protein Ct9H90mP30_3530 [Actinomycetota bacterium]|nr:MAG: hypothetical protein Ct9H90mP30_3530 [Actinomycetota bacterium]
MDDRGMPQMQPTELAAVVTEPLELELTGPGGGTWTIQPAGDEALSHTRDPI